MQNDSEQTKAKKTSAREKERARRREELEQRILMRQTRKDRARARRRGQRMRRRRNFINTIERLAVFSGRLSIVGAVLCVTLLLVYIGFEHDAHMHLFVHVRHIVRFIQGVFLANIVIQSLRPSVATPRLVKLFIWLINALMLMTLLPVVIPAKAIPWITDIKQFVYGPVYLYLALSAYSLMSICKGMMELMGRRTNPALMLAGSFIFFIIIGSFLLMMPRCTYHPIDYIDSLFVATSGVCITGLTTLDIPTTFTPLGQVIIAILFQVGGIGVLTFTSFFAIFFSGSRSIYSQLMLRDMVYSKTLNSLMPTLVYVLITIIVFEAAGAVMIYVTLPDGMFASEGEKVFAAIFQAMSAFCNVGFCNIEGGMHNPHLLNGDQTIYIVMSVLLFLGGVGFAVLVNIRDSVIGWWKTHILSLFGRNTERVPRHIIDLNTKVAMTTSLIILAIGAVAFFILESTNTMSGMNFYERSVQSVFNSLIPRSGGYDSINPADFRNVTLLLIIIQMWIGGSSQSMAGGIKVNTFGTICLNLVSIVRSRKAVGAYGRRINVTSIRRANAVVTLSILTTIVFAVILMLLEPQMSTKALIFETVSATFSVGSSMGITASLSVASKFILCLAMFVGRVGLLSLLIGMFPDRKDISDHYPSEQIIIS